MNYRFKRNIDFIVDSDYNKIKYELITKEALDSVKSDNLEPINDAVDIDPIFTPEGSKYISMKNHKLVIPQIAVKRDNGMIFVTIIILS